MTPSTAAHPALHDDLRRLWAAVTTAAVALAALLALLLASRRLAGALDAPLPVAVSASLGVVLVLAQWLVRLGMLRAGWSLVRTRLLWAVCGLLVLVVALTMTGHRDPVTGVVILWTLVVAGEIVAWGWVPKHRHGRTRFRRPSSATPSPLPDDRQEAVTADPDSLPEGLTQHWTRHRRAAGGETIEGIVTADFAPAERVKSVHLPFVPLLSGRPDVVTHQLRGPRVTIRAAEVEPYGVRLELRQARASSGPEQVVVAFEVECDETV